MTEKREKKEFPEQDELVICTVKKMIGTSIFLKLDGYGKEGVMNFSEVAPGRIRNIRDYVAPNKKVVCKVLRIDKEKGHIDLSLRRVSARDQKELLDAYNKERSNRILLKLVADDTNFRKIKEEYGKITSFFEEFMKDNAIAKKFLKEDQIEKLSKLIKEKEKERKIKVTLKLKLEHKGPQGIEVIKKVIQENKGDAEIKYVSSPLYSITLENKNYKEANRKIKEIVDHITDKIKAEGGKAEIIEK
jgi:translation initiation factor 2 subunit 1